MSNNQTVAVRNCHASNSVSALSWNRWSLEWTQMEENHDLRCSHQLLSKLAEDQRSSLSSLVEEHTETLNSAEIAATVELRQFDVTVLPLLNEMGRWETVLGFGLPLLLLTKSPEDQDGTEDGRESERKPGSVWNLNQGGGEVYAVQAGDDEPWSGYHVPGESPDDEGCERYGAGIEECDEHDTYAIGITCRFSG